MENVAHGHVCAEKTLAAGGPRAEKAAGQVLGLVIVIYFLTLA